MKKVYLPLFLFALTKACLFSFYGFGLVDEGQSLHNALKILQGGLPYKSFFAVFPPLHYYFYALPLWLFGESIVIPRLFASLIFAFSPVFLYLTLSRLVIRIIAIIPAIILIFLNVNIDRFYFMTLIFAGIYFLTLAFETEQMKYYFVSGIIFGVSSLFRLDITGVFILASAITILCAYIKKPKIAIIKTLLFSIGTLAALGSLVLWLSVNGLMTIYWKNTVIEAIVITKKHNLPFPTISDLIPYPLNLNKLSEAYAAIYGYSILFSYFITSILLVTKRIFASKIVVTFLLSGYLLLPYMFGRSDMGHLLKAGIPFLFLGAVIFSRVFSNKSKLWKLVTSTIVVAIFTGGIVESIFWIKLNNFQIEIRKQKLHVNAAYVKGTTLLSAQTLQEASSFLGNTSEAVVALPYMAGLYYLSGKISPTRYDNLLNGYLRNSSQEQQFIEDLEKAGVKRIIYDPEGGPAMATKSISIYNPQIHEYLISEYDVVKTTPEGWLFLERK